LSALDCVLKKLKVKLRICCSVFRNVLWTLFEKLSSLLYRPVDSKIKWLQVV